MCLTANSAVSVKITFTVTDLQQANRLYQRITGKPLKGQPKEKLPTAYSAKSLDHRTPTQAGAEQRAKTFQEIGDAQIVEGIVPIDEYHKRYGADRPLRGLVMNSAFGRDGEIALTSIKGKPAYTDGHFLLVGKPPAGSKIANGKRPDGDKELSKMIENVEPIKPLGGRLGTGRSEARVVFDNGGAVPASQYNHIVAVYPNATFKTNKESDGIVIYDGDKVVGGIMIDREQQGTSEFDEDTTPKEGQAEDGKVELLQAADDSLDKIYDKNRKLNYEELTSTSEAILSGRYSIKRLTQDGERGRLKSGRIGIEASIVVGAIPQTDTDGGAKSRKTEEERRLKEYAKQAGVWFNNGVLSRSLTYFTEGTESKVYRDPADPAYVIKLTPIPFLDGADSSVMRFIDDKLALHNALPNTAPYELVGFTDGEVGTRLTAVLRQPLIPGTEIDDISPEFTRLMRNDAGLLPHPIEGYQNSQLRVTDIDRHNVIKTPDGRYIIFDPIIQYVNDSDYQPFEINEAIDNEFLQAADEYPEGYLYESDFDAKGKVTPKAEKEIADERQKIETDAKADGTWLKAPNGKKSNLTPHQWVEVRTKRFKRWFGDWYGLAEIEAMDARRKDWLSSENLATVGLKSPSVDGLPTISPVQTSTAAVPRNISGLDGNLTVNNFVHPVNENDVSKVVDENGEPRTVYHGTDADIEAFDKAKTGFATDAQSAKRAFWFVEESDIAGDYAHYAATEAPVSRILSASERAAARYQFDKEDVLIGQAEQLEKDISDNRQRGQNLVPVFLNIREMPSMDAKGETFTTTENDINEFIAKAKNEGADGFQIKNLDDSPGFSDRVGTHYGVFESNQIKSTIGNAGTYSDEQDNMLLQVADEYGDTSDRKVQQSAWKRNVDLYFSGREWKNPVRMFDRTPTILKRLGLPSKDLFVTPKVIEKLRYTHGLSQGQITALFDELIDPVMVFDSATVPGSKVVVTNQTANDDSIIVAIKPNGEVTIETVETQGKRPGRTVAANILTSAYGKNRNGLQGWIDEGLLIYRNTQKGRGWWHGPYRLQLPTGLPRRAASTKKILTQDDFVNNESLFKLADDESKELLSQVLPFVHTQDLMDAANDEIKAGTFSNFKDGRLEVSEVGAEWLRRANKNRKSFYGQTFDKPDLVTLRRNLELGVKQYRELGYSEEQLEPLKQLAKDFQKLVEAAKPGIAYVFDEAIPEEDHHSLTLEALNGKRPSKQFYDGLKGTDAWKNAKFAKDGKSFASKYGKTSDFGWSFCLVVSRSIFKFMGLLCLEINK